MVEHVKASATESRGFDMYCISKAYITIGMIPISLEHESDISSGSYYFIWKHATLCQH